MQPQRLVDRALIPHRAARRLGLLQEMVNQVFFQANRDARLAARLRFLNFNPSTLATAEIVLLFQIFTPAKSAAPTQPPPTQPETAAPVTPFSCRPECTRRSLLRRCCSPRQSGSPLPPPSPESTSPPSASDP